MKITRKSFVVFLLASPVLAVDRNLDHSKDADSILYNEKVTFHRIRDVGRFWEESTIVELEKRRGGSRGGSSSGSGRSTSSSAGSTRGSTVTTSSTRLSNGRYAGGSAAPFIAGAATGLGLGAIFLLSASAAGHYPGYWGNHGVYDYSYNFTEQNGTNFNVHCYCMRYNPCSCDKIESENEIKSLPPDVSKVTSISNDTYTVGINGTLANNTSPAPTVAAKSSSNAVGSPKILFTLVIAAGTLIL